ncbi:MAG: sulfatase-like hydrolase/transferase [Alcanivorax sp.]|nr:sulfatase-like hydrolase/transferase [Alcanivorax sp.]
MSFRHPAEPDFPGKIGRTVADSEPSWPEPRMPQGAPNIVLVVLDDAGFSHLGCYGSSIATPHIDRLAGEGLRYTGFHTTALCSATRACLLSGRNHHAAGIRAISNFDTGYPNTRGAIPPNAALLPAILRDAGYATFATGKWHLAPMRECSAAGPFTNWPLQKGFDRFYGFMQGETDQFYPELTYDNHFVEPPRSPEQGYHVSEDIVDRSLDFIRDSVSLVPEKPWLLYLAMGAMHAPHQAPQAYLDKYRGKFDHGWEKERERWFERQKALGIIPPDTALAPQNPGVPDWDTLPDDHKKFASRLQEAFAAMLEHTDAQIGRLMAGLAELGQDQNTLFVLISDNGASQEGGATGTLDEMRYFNGMKEDVAIAVKRLDDIGTPRSHSNIPWGWAQAGNTPLKWYKQNTHGGGVRDPLILHWPGRLGKPGEVRHTFCHAVDIAPTLLDLIGLPMPDTVAGVPQMPLHGVSLKATLDQDVDVPREAQYFEMLGHRAIWADGWKAVTHHRRGSDYDTEEWELYNLNEDFSESNNLAHSEPEKLEHMKALWWREAEKNGVLPLDDRKAGDLFRGSRRKGVPTSRKRFVYYPPVSHIVSDACPPVYKGFTLTVELPDHPERGDGVLVSRGTINSGFVLYIQGGKVHFDHNGFHDHTHLVSERSLTPGEHTVTVTLTRREDGGGDVTLALDGEPQARGSIPRLLVMLSSIGMDFGRCLSPVTEGYSAPFPYPGRIRRVIFDLPSSGGGKLDQDADKANQRAIMAQQ